MRLWHIDLIQYLPKSQLKAQWRELNSIFKKQDNHILINYIYTYPKEYLFNYSLEVISQIRRRDIKIRSLDNFNNYFNSVLHKHLIDIEDLRFSEHNNEYLAICYWNLREKYLRGQKDFKKECFEKLYDFVNTKFDLKSLGIEKE